MSATARQTLAAVALLLAATLFLYRGILFPTDAAQRYPWASDTLGHVLKAEYLRQQMQNGVFYPNLFPAWYAGLQLFRYHPPLPYYGMVLLTLPRSDPVAAANLYIAACALLGALAWLPYRRWLGWEGALLGGALYLFMPDSVRVALAEGNLPRVLATALLPLTFYCLLRCLEDDAPLLSGIGLAAGFAALVLCHAMMAAIYAACGALLALLCWLTGVTSLQRAVRTVMTAALGVLFSGWWLLPSLTGGITELDASAMTEALAAFPLTTYLNPLLRLQDLEIVYPGAALLVLTVALGFAPQRAEGHALALAGVGMFGVLISTHGFNALFQALPLSNLFWPLRFLGVAGFALLLGILWRTRTWTAGRWRWGRWALLALIAADSAVSLRLVHLRAPHPDVSANAAHLAALPGWREATLDDSRLGSAAAYFFTAAGGREQLYGWAYQGARTARNVAAINEALHYDYFAYALDRLTLFGVDDVVLLDGLAPEVVPALERAGFAERARGAATALYHRDGQPRIYAAEWPALGIGSGAQNLAYLFPQIVLGASAYLDDYTSETLQRYQTVILSGFGWRDRAAAEALAQAAAHAGVRVVVDLTGAPLDPLARKPLFLGVWGEALVLPQGALPVLGDAGYALDSFYVAESGWQAITPQGLDHEVLYHEYLGAHSTILGYNEYVGAGRVWFIGLNLPYHAMLSHDPAALKLLATVLALPLETPNAYHAIPLRGYRAGPAGYEFTGVFDRAGQWVLPVAAHEGAVVRVDGALTPVQPLESLLAFAVPAGEHRIAVQMQPTRIETLGKIVSLLAGGGLVIVLGGWMKIFHRQDTGN